LRIRELPACGAGRKDTYYGGDMTGLLFFPRSRRSDGCRLSGAGGEYISLSPETGKAATPAWRCHNKGESSLPGMIIKVLLIY
jgi:hypothetical protein